MSNEEARSPEEGPEAVEAGELFVLSAPSGAGKTTLIRRLFEVYPDVAERLTFAVSHTTRPARQGEVDGRDYHFVDRDRFEAEIEADGFLEWAVVHGHLYGTGRAGVETLRIGGRDVLLDIDVQGAEQVLDRCPEAVSIFILPPSFAELRRRLEGRASDSPEQVVRRLRTATEEVRRCELYEYVILNDDLEVACGSLAAVFRARQCHRDRMARTVQRVFDEFPRPEELPGEFHSR